MKYIVLLILVLFPFVVKAQEKDSSFIDTVEQIIEVFADQFPEMLLALAEENWVNGYTQALNDVEYMKDKNVSEEIHQEKEG